MNTKKGFTLVEIVVAVGLFAIVVLITLSTLLALTHANRKAQAIQSVMNNLNIALDGMVRTIRAGTNYHCGPGSYQGGGSSDDCASPGNTRFVVEAFGGSSAPGDEIVYMYDSGTKSILKSKNNGLSFVAITAPEVSITDMKFYLVGTSRQAGDTAQPKVLISIKGTAGSASAGQTSFNIQATAVQRVLDL